LQKVSQLDLSIRDISLFEAGICCKKSVSLQLT